MELKLLTDLIDTTLNMVIIRLGDILLLASDNDFLGESVFD